MNAPIQTRHNKVKNPQPTLLDQSDAQVGYGEPTIGSIKRILTVMKEHYWEEAKAFVDIGSGFGQVVYFFAIQTDLECYGYDIVSVRIQVAEDFKKKLSETHRKNPMIIRALERVHF